MSGKGSVPRPFDVPRAVFEANHARIFGAKPAKERYTPPPLSGQLDVKHPIAASNSPEFAGFKTVEFDGIRDEAAIATGRAQRTNNPSEE